ncbi:MAG TPA: hypothetical protein VIJ92_13405 [Ginsengibacter sp.]
MKKLKQLSVIIFLFYLCSCNNSSSASGNQAHATTTSTTAATGGDASFSCKIDGKDFSGMGTDQMANATMVTTPGIISFILSPVVAGQEGLPAQFAFHVADKGTTTIHGTDNPNYSTRYTPANSTANDECKDMIIIITSSGTSRVTGTFSGTLTEPGTDRTVPVTDGKFDIPYSSYSKK